MLQSYMLSAKKARVLLKIYGFYSTFFGMEQENLIQSVQDRLKFYAAARKRSVRGFETECGLSNGFVNNVKEQMRFDAMAKIKGVFPALSLEWLILGAGPMELGGGNVSVSGANIVSSPGSSMTGVTSGDASALLDWLRKENERLTEQNTKLTDALIKAFGQPKEGR